MSNPSPMILRIKPQCHYNVIWRCGYATLHLCFRAGFHYAQASLHAADSQWIQVSIFQWGVQKGMISTKPTNIYQWDTNCSNLIDRYWCWSSQIKWTFPPNSTLTSVASYKIQKQCTLPAHPIKHPPILQRLGASQILVATWNGAHDAPVDVWPYRPIKWCHWRVPDSWGYWRYLAKVPSPKFPTILKTRKGPQRAPHVFAPSGLPSTAQKT